VAAACLRFLIGCPESGVVDAFIWPIYLVMLQKLDN